MKEPLEEVRLDLWLFAARFYKTRSQAGKACNGNKVKINGLTAKPHKTVRTGDKLTIHHRGRYRNLEILRLEKRGLPPALARELYHEEISRLDSESEELIMMMRQLEKRNRSAFKGRPTKRDRRRMDQLRDEINNG